MKARDTGRTFLLWNFFNIGEEAQLHYLCTLYRQQASIYIYKVIFKDGINV